MSPARIEAWLRYESLSIGEIGRMDAVSGVVTRENLGFLPEEVEIITDGKETRVTGVIRYGPEAGKDIVLRETGQYTTFPGVVTGITVRVIHYDQLPEKN